MYKEARKQAKMTLENAAWDLHIAERTLCNYEAGVSIPAADIVLKMASLYNKSDMTQQYCRHECPIGKKFSYEILNNVNLSPDSVMFSLEEEWGEAEGAFGMLRKILRNIEKKAIAAPDRKTLEKCMSELLDVEHNIEILKIVLSNWLDTAKLVEEHNQKCRVKGYVKEGLKNGKDISF